MAAGTPGSDPSVVAGLAYLHANQTTDGGFPYSPPFESDANSTAYVIQAIIALGQSAEAGGPWDLGAGANPLAKLLSFQNPATGALTAFGADSPFATYQGVPGLMLAAFPEQEQPDDFTATPTSTSTSSPTATRTPTTTSTQTSSTPTSSVSTSTPATIATTVANTPAPNPAVATATAVNAVLGATAPPPHTGVVALPNTGRPEAEADSPLAVLALAASGAALVAAGITGIRKRRTAPKG